MGLNANLICLTFSGQEFLWFASDLHAFYWLVRDFGQEIRANAPSPTSNGCQAPLNVMGWLES